MIRSKALEVNIASYHVDVSIDEKYAVFQEVMSPYYGLTDGVNTFLKELSHPYKNWRFIINEARGYTLDYFHLLKKHPKGPEAARILIGTFTEALDSDADIPVKSDAVDHLLRYLQKIIVESEPGMEKFTAVVFDVFEEIRSFPDDYFHLFVKSYYQLKRLAENFRDRSSDPQTDITPLISLLLRYYHTAYDYWLSEKNPLEWFEEEAEDIENRSSYTGFFIPISHKTIAAHKRQLDDIANEKRSVGLEKLDRLLELPSYNEIVEIYRSIPGALFEAARTTSQANRWKVIFLFHSMNVSGLSVIHEDTLRDINRTVSWLIQNESHIFIRNLLEQTFSILKEGTLQYPATALNCILNMGEGVYKTDESELVDYFIDCIIDLGFQSPRFDGVGNDWQIRVNSAHIQNIRIWLKLIELKPKWSRRLLSNLIIHLAISGVFIKDTDLFPRDITQLLNSDIGPTYNLIKQLVQLLPVFFNDIGAEGKLRDISTEIDELTNRRDVLIHFLRKQSHVESSNRIPGFMEATIRFWETRDKSELKEYVPPAIYDRIETNGPYIEGVHLVISQLKKRGVSIPKGLLTLPEKELSHLLEYVTGVSPADLDRVELLVTYYKLLNQKYNLDSVEILHYIQQLNAEAFPDLGKIKAALNETDLHRKLFALLEYLELLKSIVLSPQSFEIKEDIYKKRHFTVDIPSMYGSYHEMKFNAMGLTLRLESLVNMLFEELISKIDLNLITRATFNQIFDRLMLYDKALKLNGITSVELETQLDLLAHSLEIRGFTYTQYLDIFKGFAQAVKNIINDYFNNIHSKNLTRIISTIPNKQLLSKYLPPASATETEKLADRVSEIFLRDRLAGSLGLQQLDVFLSRILNTLFHQSSKLPSQELRLLLNYDPQAVMIPLIKSNSRSTGIIQMGKKGLNMMKLKNFGMPVPPGFIISTEAYRCRQIIEGFLPAAHNFREQVARQIALVEKASGKEFGSATNPLLFSVRSGSSISQPGMMDTFLNVGINESIAEGLAARTGNKWFAWDSYRRFLQCAGMAFGLERDDFDAIIDEFKEEMGTPLKAGFTGEQMKQVALAYRQRIQDDGHTIPEQPIEQVHLTINNVLSSWESEKARTYRTIMGISDDWGTAVTVQEMVYGNLSQHSGSGVIFTHNPRWAGETLCLWGDFSLANQGEDVVSGLVNTLPISIQQQDLEMRNTDITLESHFPEIYRTMKDFAKLLVYEKGWSPQEIEFTFEGPSAKNLWLLQTRGMAIRERKKAFTFDYREIQQAELLGSGIGVSGGAMSGRVVFGLDDIEHYRKTEPATHLILARSDTVPDDIKQIHAADGLLTARGGVTSHAAVVVHRLGKTCVVGCGSLICNEKDKHLKFTDVTIESGDYISIDGREGTVYQGRMQINET
ncbi:MAG: pyruvate, phosphate dikinase [Desulfobacteraceae bacterium]|nr:pyruvate, phosphate dikinase [Desulfobacteraceae bacterium]